MLHAFKKEPHVGPVCSQKPMIARDLLVAERSVARYLRRIRRPVLLLCHRARAAQDASRQRDPPPDSRVRRPANARGLPGGWSYRYVIFERDSKFNNEVVTFLKATGLEPKRTSVQAPWQNGIAEPWVGSCRREILDHGIALNEPHLRRLMRDYVHYYHEDRIHDGLSKDKSNRRPIEQKHCRKQP
jgi:hypothetical protein